MSFSLKRRCSMEFWDTDLWMFSESMFLLSYKGQSLQPAEFEDNPVKSCQSRGSCQIQSKHHWQMKRSSVLSRHPSSSDRRGAGPWVWKQERGRPRPKLGHRQSSLMSWWLWEAIRYLDKPCGYPNWQHSAQSHLYSLSSGVRHHYKIYLSWYTPVRKRLATPCKKQV